MARFPTVLTLAAALTTLHLSSLAFAKRTRAFDIAPQWCPNTISRQAINPRLAGSCQGVIIPPNICTPCRMRKFDKNGNFADNRDIYDLSSPGCQAGLKRYTKLNPCDGPRVRQVRTYARALAKGKMDKWAYRAQKDLGEFMYNVCELCCDCVPMGARPWHYSWRRKNRKWTGNFWSLIHVYRGNCPVHYYYDTCRMWPNLRDIAPPGRKPNLKLSKICPDHVYPWWNVKKYRNNWLANPKATIPDWRFVNFLVKMTSLLRCKDQTMWKECARLEMAQRRI